MARMLPKSKRSLDVYKRIGAEMQLCNALLVRAACDVSEVVPDADRVKMDKAIELLNTVRYNAESQMFRDHPDLDDSYNHVFCSTLAFHKIDPKPMDVEIIGLMRTVMSYIFGDIEVGSSEDVFYQQSLNGGPEM